MRGKLFVVSGPSGVGKNTLLNAVVARSVHVRYSISATSRAMRPGEVDGKSYYFLSQDEFDRKVQAGEFVEWAHVHGHCYGTLASEVERNLASGSSLILEIDVQGALQVREHYPDAVLVFIKPPSLDVLRERLVHRGTESAESLELRLANARQELELADRYDEVIVNDDLDRAPSELVGIIEKYERN